MAIALGALLAGAIYTWFVGEDVNWDWQNYHEYNVWAVITGRYGIDALPAGFQTYFNPTVYFPVYYLRHLLPLPYGLMILGAVHGLNLLLIYFLIRVLLREAATAIAIGAAILIAAVGPMTLSEVGTSFSDILTALPIVAGCILILSAEERHGRYILAGLLIGAAVGLKLTNVVYALGAAAAVLAAGRPLLATLCLGVGGAIGAVATGGVWGLMLWREMGNPIFPLFNGIFQSRELVPMNIMDWQFMPRGFLDALGLSLLLAGRRQQEFGVSVSRRPVCGRDAADPARHRQISRHPRYDLHATRHPVPAVLRRLVCGMARGVFDSALRHRAGAVVCAADRPVDFPQSRRATWIVHAGRIVAARQFGDGCKRPADRIVVATGRLVPPPLVQSIQSSHSPAASTSLRTISFSTSRSPTSLRDCRRSRGSIRSPTLPCPSCPTARSTVAFAPG